MFSHIKKTIRQVDRYSPFPLFYPFLMSDEEKRLFDRSIDGVNVYLEFGLGGSSLRAIRKSNAQIYSVESSVGWIDTMREYVAIRRSEKKRLHIVPVDIGPTHEWGRPEAENASKFPAYSSCVYDVIDKNNIDLALIDGRFRVACTLKLIMECYENTALNVLIHDFWNREQYHIVLKYLDPIEKVDTLGLFKIKKDLDLTAVQEDYERYKFEPE